jgi:membrane-bound lytic murein transglycosylase
LIFTRAYLAEYLDLDYKTSFQLAQRLSVDYDGNPKIAAKDFLKLVDFCTSDKEVGLSKPRCGVIAARVVQKTEGFHAQTADEFIKVYHFMVAEKGASSPVVKALEVAENVVEQGPEASDNFIAAYKYATEHKGLDFTAERALAFAQSLSRNTWFNSHDHTLPAPMVELPTPADPAAKSPIEVRAPAGSSAAPVPSTAAPKK